MKRLIGRTVGLTFCLAALMVLSTPLHAQFELGGGHVAAGSTSASGGEFVLEGTIGQAVTGTAAGGSFTEWRGFWYLAQPPTGPRAGSAQISLTALHNDSHAGGTLIVAVEVKTRGLASHTLGSAVIDVDYNGEHLSFSDHTAGPIVGTGTLVGVDALSGDPESGRGSGDFIRLSVITSDIGTDHSGYDVGEEYVVFGSLDFTITEAGAVSGSSDLFVRPGSLALGFYESPQNANQSGHIVPVVIDEVLDLYQTALPVDDPENLTTELAGAFRLGALYPNPFNPQARFSLAVQQSQHVRIDVFDVLGRNVAVLHNDWLTANQVHIFTFDARHLTSGTYLIRIRGVHFAAVQKGMLLR